MHFKWNMNKFIKNYQHNNIDMLHLNMYNIKCKVIWRLIIYNGN